MGVIHVIGATEHNLQDVSLIIPKGKLFAVTGVSGSGKSTLVFETIYAESFRRFSDASAVPAYILGNVSSGMRSRPKFKSITGLPVAMGLSQKQGVAGKLSTVGTISGVADLLRVYWAAFGEVSCASCAIPLRAIAPDNILAHIAEKYAGQQITVVGSIAEKRKGAFAPQIERFRQLGYSRLRLNGEIFDLQEGSEHVPIDAKKLNTLEILIDKFMLGEGKEKRLRRAVMGALENSAGVVKIECGLDTEIFNTGATCPQCGESAPTLDPRHFSHSSLGKCEACEGTGSAMESASADLFPCAQCLGTRLGPIQAQVKIKAHTLSQILTLRTQDVSKFVDMLWIEARGDRAKSKVLGEARRILSAIYSLGIGHLSLNRAGTSLVPGDLQRLRLASMFSNKLRGVLYVLDEPCQGLTAQEVQRFTALLRGILNEGSTILVVEHHPSFLAACDMVATLGPGAGAHGGRLLQVQPGSAFAQERGMVAAKSSAGPGIEIPEFSCRGLRFPALKIPQKAFTLIRGVSGSGKCTLLRECIEPALNYELKLQSEKPLYGYKFTGTIESLSVAVPGATTRSSRRTLAAALEVLPHLRLLFAGLPQAKLMGITESHFSWSTKMGRCENCEGKGVRELKQRFGPAIEIECETCLGARLNSRSLVPRWKGRNFAELMQLSMEEVAREFANYRMVEQRLRPALEFGLGYLQLGQTLDMLSGGELQRLLLVMEFRRASLAGAWMLLVHPCTGLHSPDIAMLGKLICGLTQKGATVVAADNREELAEFADQIVDLGV